MQIPRKRGEVKKKKSKIVGVEGLGSFYLTLLSTYTRVITYGVWGGRAVYEKRAEHLGGRVDTG